MNIDTNSVFQVFKACYTFNIVRYTNLEFKGESKSETYIIIYLEKKYLDYIIKQICVGRTAQGLS